MSRKVQGLEENLETTEEKTKIAQVKFDQVSVAGDESERFAGKIVPQQSANCYLNCLTECEKCMNIEMLVIQKN